MATPEKATTPLGAMGVLEPRQLKPDSAETERILTVLDETITKLEMTRLIPRITGSLERFARMLGPEITASLLEHQKLSNEMQHLLASPGAQETMRAREQRLKCSLRHILRLLLANPLLCQGLKYQVQVRASPADAFIKAFAEFRDFMLEKLLTSPAEEREKIQFVEEMSLKAEQNTEVITALQAELAAAIQTRKEEMDRKDKMIEDLKTTMENLAKDRKAEIQQMKKEGAKQREEEVKAAQGRCARLQEDVQRLRVQFSALVEEHRASELLLRKRKCRTEEEIENWIQKYDTDMAAKQATFEAIHAVYTEEKAQLAQLMEKHALLLQEYSQIEEERKMLKQKEEEELQEQARRNRAATSIQAAWRGYVVRSFFKAKLKKARAKAKGKGGKK
ncbi:dynein regulatory complex protein 10 isoform X1 [Manacus candei]|uniref:dynein regulatory complex protein 10 isoform X1 n=1 Tax=Manacus candei TaxID=415023 RepID=UPI002225EE5D|nr:dynein regulatory complex protein 10 isoform X1 [Manacus candei]XP_051629332.1 dynein regulatory complex protein 10 isoform X1 [Manacus candei]XP_051629333.1 dynein regulatory complex protein 10 isoform X1 [Manacus candei]XP_051629334.1 dynein regulatory complex protein 10 isoform X1 [Manacus candei]